MRRFDDPIKTDSHLVILYGNLAPDGAVAKITGKEGLRFTGKARVFESEEDALQAILDGAVRQGDVIVIRYEGPKGGPGMREMLSPTAAIMGRGLGKDCRADHRRTLLRRQPRLRRRSRHARGCSRRPDRARARRRPDHDRCEVAGGLAGGLRGGARAPPERLEGAQPWMMFTACWPSTVGSLAAPRKARSTC